MSMSSWSEQGFGVELFNRNNMDNIKSFLIAKGELNNDEVDDIIDDNYLLEDVLGEPVSYVIARIINHELGTTLFSGFCSCGDTNTEEHIGISPWYPWGMKEEDLNFFTTKEDAIKVFKPYLNELGIKEEPDYFSLEYFG